MSLIYIAEKFPLFSVQRRNSGEKRS